VKFGDGGAGGRLRAARKNALAGRQILSECQNPCYSILWSVEAPPSSGRPAADLAARGEKDISWFRATSR
jgi:hypothetical protein